MSSTLHFIGDSTAVDSVDIQRPSSDYSTSDSRCATSAGSGLSSKKLNGFGLLTPALTVVPNLNVAVGFKDLREEDRDIVLAAAHIDDAKTSRGRYGKASNYFKERHAQIAFKFITNVWFKRLIYAAIILHSVLTFIEPPNVQPRSVESYIAVSLNLICLLLYLLDIILNVSFLSWKVFWTFEERSWNRVEFVFLCCFTIDWLLLIAQISSGNRDIVQPFRCFRLGMIVCKANNVGHITNVVMSIIVKLGGVIFMVLVFILLYSCIGVHLVMRPFERIDPVNISAFRPYEEFVMTERFDVNETVVFIEVDSMSSINDTNIYEGTFNHIGVAAYQLFILLTTENYPVFMFPAYNHTQWYFVYFGTFLFFGVFFITSILLAIIADSYWQYNKKYVKKERAKQRAELVKAWKLLDVLEQERLPVDDLKLLKLFRLLKPKNTDSDNSHLIAELDPEGTGWVHWIQWVTQLLSILDLENLRRHRRGKLRSTPRLLLVASKIARKIAAWPGFDKIVLILIIIHTILFALKWQGMSLGAEVTVQALKTFIVTLFVVEMTIRIIGMEKAFFNSLINTLDFVFVVIGFIANIFWYAILSSSFEAIVDGFLWRGVFVVISCLFIFLRLFFNSNQSRLVMTVFIRLFPIMLDLIILFGIVMYFYGVLGMEIFHSFIITSDTPDADHLQYSCGLGFENFKCSLYILFQILTTSNWHEIMNALVISLDSYAPSIYFISCYIVINFIIMNLLVAIGIEAFIKFSQEHKRDESEVDKSFRTSSNSGTNGAETSAPKRLAYVVKKTLSTIAAFVSAAFSSARMVEDEQNDDSVIHIEIRDHTPRDHMIFENQATNEEQTPISSRNSSESSKTLLLQPSTSSLEDKIGPVNEIHSSVLHSQQNESVEDIETADDVFVQSPYVPVKPAIVINRQEKMKRMLKERQKQIRMKLPANAVSAVAKLQTQNIGGEAAGNEQAEPDDGSNNRSSISSISGSNSERGQDNINNNMSGKIIERKHRSIKWGSAARAISFMSQFGSGVNSNENTDQLDAKDARKSSKASPKFRRGYSNGNWGSEVQNITIINKEEISELRRQLAAKSTLKTNAKMFAKHKTSSMEDTSSSHGYRAARKPSLDQKNLRDCNQSSVDSTLTLTQLNMQDNSQAERRRSLLFSVDSSTDSNVTVVDSLPQKLVNPDSEDSIANSQPRCHSVSHDQQCSVQKHTTIVSVDDQAIIHRPSGRSLGLSSETESIVNAQSTRSSLSNVSDTIGAGVQTFLPDYQSDDFYTSEVNDLPVDVTKGEMPQFDASGRIRNVRSFSRTPLISVEEVTEPISNISSPSNSLHNLRVPGSKSNGLRTNKIPSSSFVREDTGEETGGDERVNKTIPDWVVKLTQKYHVTVHTETAVTITEDK